MHIGHKALVPLLIDQLAEFYFGYRLHPQDYFDSLVGNFSAGLAMILFVLILARMYFYRSIECFVPAEWPDPWEQAAEAYCYTEGAYAVPRVNLNKTGPDAWEVKVPQTYYYWVPFILMALAIILKFPDLLWDLYCQHNDKQPAQTLAAVSFLTAGAADESEASRLRLRLGQHLMSEDPGGRGVDFRTRSLFAAYLASKGLRLTVSLASVAFLQRSFGLPSPLFGALAWLRSPPGESAASAEEVDSFPTLTFCDVALRQLGQWNVRTVQCVLPVNLLLDKIALFFWFWLVACGLVCLASAGVWLARVGSEARRRRYVKTFVRVLRSCSERSCWGRSRSERSRSERSCSERRKQLSPVELSLVDAISSVDRVFILRLIQERLGMAAAYVAMETMTEHYLTVRYPPNESDPDCV